MSFSGKTVLITGASSGIGRALAHRLGAEGARLILTARSQERLEQVATEVSPAEAIVCPADLCDAASIEALCDEVRERFGRIDILINNAGVSLYALSYDSSPEKVRRLFELNFLAPVELTRRLAPAIAATICSPCAGQRVSAVQGVGMSALGRCAKCGSNALAAGGKPPSPPARSFKTHAMSARWPGRSCCRG